MKRTPLFALVILCALWLTGCGNGTTDTVDDIRPAKTTRIEEIYLKARHYEIPPVENWTGGWETEIGEQRLWLSNLLPNGEMKSSTPYEVTISGTSDVRMDQFQLVFTVPGLDVVQQWHDCSEPSAEMTVPKGPFSLTVTLTTKAAMETHIDRSMLALTNAVETAASDNNQIKAILTDVVITIKENLK